MTANKPMTKEEVVKGLTVLYEKQFLTTDLEGTEILKQAIIILTQQNKPTQQPHSQPKRDKHIIQKGSREHVVYYDEKGRHCSEPNCEINYEQSQPSGQNIGSEEIEKIQFEYLNTHGYDLTKRELREGLAKHISSRLAPISAIPLPKVDDKEMPTVFVRPKCPPHSWVKTEFGTVYCFLCAKRKDEE